MRRRFLAAFCISITASLAAAQRADKLLIIHADDLGMAHSVNAASIKALESGAINSASVMVPCPWFPEIAAWARQHADADLGLHLTLTSEWAYYRWGPVLSKTLVPSLLDPDGYLHRTEAEAAAKIDPAEAEAEIRAQIARARAFGIRPTHLDAHMRTLHQNAALFRVLLKVAHDNGIPAAIPRAFTNRADFGPLIGPGDIVIDNMITITPEVSSKQWASYYEETIHNLKPGLTELIVHLGYDDAELQAITADHPNWGAAWRQRDFNVLRSDRFRRLLRDYGVKLVTWRELSTSR